MARPRVDFDRLGDVILVFMYEQFMADGAPNFSADELSKAIPSIPLNAITLRLRELAASQDRIYEEKKEVFDNNFLGLFGGSRTPPEPRLVGTGRYRLTRKGIDYVAALKDEHYDSLVSATNVPPSKAPKIPASDRYVSRSDNQDLWDQSIASLDRVITEFKSDHRIDNELGAEKSALLKALEAGRQLFENGAINVRIGVALTLEPLRRIASRYEQALASAAITLGMNQVPDLVRGAIELLTKLFR